MTCCAAGHSGFFLRYIAGFAGEYRQQSCPQIRNCTHSNALQRKDTVSMPATSAIALVILLVLFVRNNYNTDID